MALFVLAGGDSLPGHGYLDASERLVMQIFNWIWIVAMAFACSVWAEEIAKLKGHNSKQWLVLGLLFGPVALIALAGYPDLEDRKHQRDSAAELSLIKDDIDAMRRGKD